MDTTCRLRSFSPIYSSKFVNICRSPSAKCVCHSDSFFRKASILPCTVNTSLSCPCKDMFSSFNREKHPPSMQPWLPTHRRTRVFEISHYFAVEKIL